ncbi:transglutaminase TgpA family protein [Microbacterium sp. CJ88]|uniref:transglutaminase TgpA family protein n=1 Tax=Microbacterium sp. CJ88 TaxID=3445672 RepID=UPI003F659364
MSSGEAQTRRPAELALTLGVFVAVVAALLPLLRVVSSGGWVPGAIALAALVLTAGYLARWFRLPALAASILEAAVWIVVVTLVFLRDTALLGVIPTPETLHAAPQLLRGAFDQIQQGAAPLAATPELSFLIVGALGLLAIMIDHVVITARMPLLAAVGLIAISLVPSIAVPGALNVVAFVLLAGAILFLLRVEVRAREAPKDARVRTRAAAHGVTATAVGIGAIAVVVALVAAPLLPAPQRAGGGLGTGASIDPSLQLGDDLRRPSDTEVLRVRTNSGTAPYLRVATLSSFDGVVWQPDRAPTLPLSTAQSLGPIAVDPGVTVNPYTTDIQVENLVTSWLPVSFPAVEVTGLDGDWAAMPANRTVVGRSGTSQGQSYQVQTQVPRPTLEQIRARSADGRGPNVSPESLALPAELPAIIAQTARDVTAGATTDYDRLHELQTWFRSSAFRYSLSAPVQDGFDGSGADAVASFLQVRSGYCVHFASAFALMARTLGMPARIVVGYLPGSSTGQNVDGQAVYVVQSGQLHAWPEVYFDGIGWVPFEPTNSLGVPTNFVSDSITGGTPGEAARQTTAPTSSPAPTSSLDPTANDPTANDPAVAGGAGGGGLVPVGTVLLGILLALAVPAVVRAVLRRRLLLAARHGDAAAAWRAVQDEAIDLGIPVPASESPRMFAARLAAERGVDAAAMGALVRAIERASYAPGHRRDPAHGDETADAAASVCAHLRASTGAAARLLATLAPRSLVVRPGSVYAGSVPPPHAR